MLVILVIWGCPTFGTPLCVCQHQDLLNMHMSRIHIETCNLLLTLQTGAVNIQTQKDNRMHQA